MELYSDPRKKLEFIRPSDIVPIKEDKSDDNSDDNTVDLTSEDDSEHGLEAQVFLRLRPIPSAQSETYLVRENKLIVRSSLPKPNEAFEKSFEFSKIFPDDTTQRTLFDECVSPSITQLSDIDGATFLTYGTSGSGKTYTTIGDISNPGLVPRAIIQLFSQYDLVITKKPLFKTDFQKRTQVMLCDYDVGYESEYSELIQEYVTDATPKFKASYELVMLEHGFPRVETNAIRYANVYVSFIEIYNEAVRDLLNIDGEKRSLKIMGNDGDSYVAGGQWVFAPTMEACYKIIEYGLRNVKFGETKVNSRSSRSHTILMIDFIAFYKNRNIQHTLYKFCDLAGSERAKKTNAAGDRLTEAKQINKSLMTLGRCLQIIHNNQKGAAKKVVPVRDSKLTFLLQSGLLGQQKLVMIVNLMPSNEFYDENVNVLNFSAIAKQIVKTKPEIKRERRSSGFSSLFSLPIRPSSFEFENANETEVLISKLTDENEHLKLVIKSLKEEMLVQEMQIRNELIQTFEEAKVRREELNEFRVKNAVDREARKWEMKVMEITSPVI